MLDEQAFHIVLVDILGEQVAAGVELVNQACAIHHGHDVVDCELGVAVRGVLRAEFRDGIGDWHGLADTRRLDYDVVELVRCGDGAELR